MTICDASVVVKWVRRRGEEEVAEARAILAAHDAGTLVARVLDLTHYELGNALGGRAGWDPREIATRVAALREVCGEPIRPRVPELADAAHLAAEHDLTFYDASYWAVARALDADLVTADAELIEAGAGESPSAYCERLGIELG